MHHHSTMLVSILPKYECETSIIIYRTTISQHWVFYDSPLHQCIADTFPSTCSNNFYCPYTSQDQNIILEADGEK